MRQQLSIILYQNKGKKGICVCVWVCGIGAELYILYVFNP